jgi:hypothetical protein
MLGAELTLATLLDKQDATAQKIAANEDVRRLVTDAIADLSRFPHYQSSMDWAIIRGVDPAAAEKFAAVIKADPLFEPELKVSLALYPWSAPEALSAIWYYQIRNEPAKARDIYQKVVTAGTALPPMAAR